MCELLDSIDGVIVAAKSLTRACARHAAISDAMSRENPVVVALRRSFQSTAETPADMLSAIGRIT